MSEQARKVISSAQNYYTSLKGAEWSRAENYQTELKMELAEMERLVGNLPTSSGDIEREPTSKFCQLFRSGYTLGADHYDPPKKHPRPLGPGVFRLSAQCAWPWP